METSHRIESALRAVLKLSELNYPIALLNCSPMGCPEETVGVTGLPGHVQFFYHPASVMLLSDTELEAIVAHEVGHITLGHTATRPSSASASQDREYQADSFAASIGYGPDLATALEKIVSTFGGPDYIAEEVSSWEWLRNLSPHPPTALRAARLRSKAL